SRSSGWTWPALSCALSKVAEVRREDEGPAIEDEGPAMLCIWRSPQRLTHWCLTSGLRESGGEPTGAVKWLSSNVSWLPCQNRAPGAGESGSTGSSTLPGASLRRTYFARKAQLRVDTSHGRSGPGVEPGHRPSVTNDCSQATVH